MAQQIYTSLSGKQKKKWRKAVIIPMSIAAAVLAGLSAVGLITGSQSDEHFTVAEAVAENVQLKQQNDYLTSEVERLSAEVERLGGELAARPVVIEPTQQPLPASGGTSGISPRGYYN